MKIDNKGICTADFGKSKTELFCEKNDIDFTGVITIYVGDAQCIIYEKDGKLNVYGDMEKTAQVFFDEVVKKYIINKGHVNG